LSLSQSLEGSPNIPAERGIPDDTREEFEHLIKEIHDAEQAADSKCGLEAEEKAQIENLCYSSDLWANNVTSLGLSTSMGEPTLNCLTGITHEFQKSER
jgi:hypothetical protein